MYLIALPYEFREMALTYFDLLFFIKKELAALVSILTFYWQLIALKHLFCLKTFDLKFDVVSER